MYRRPICPHWTQFTRLSRLFPGVAPHWTTGRAIGTNHSRKNKGACRASRCIDLRRSGEWSHPLAPSFYALCGDARQTHSVFRRNDLAHGEEREQCSGFFHHRSQRSHSLFLCRKWDAPYDRWSCYFIDSCSGKKSFLSTGFRARVGGGCRSGCYGCHQNSAFSNGQAHCLLFICGTNRGG